MGGGGWPARHVTPVTKTEIAHGSGEDAIEFIEMFCRVTKDSLGGGVGEHIRLRSWQKRLIEHMLARRADGAYLHRQMLIGMARKNAKAQRLDEPLLTVGRGWVTYGSIRPGDMVYHPSGRPVAVLAVSRPVVNDVYDVSFADGRVARGVGAGHEWTVKDRNRKRDGGVRTVETTELASGLFCGNRSSHRERRYSVPVPGVLDSPDVALPVDPWLYGYWMGNGRAAAGVLTAGSLRGDRDAPHVVSRVVAAGFGCSVRAGDSSDDVKVPGLWPVLRSSGLGKGFVPESYLLAGTGQRRALLAGLMDSDGTREKPDRVSFSTTRGQVADDVLYLARSLGYKATVVESRASLDGVDRGPYWKVSFPAVAGTSPFSLPRKAEGLAVDYRGERHTSIQVVDVSPVGESLVRCIEVDSPDGLYLTGRDLVPTHNSTLLSGLSLWNLLTGPAGGEVYAVAGSKDQARIIFSAVRRMVEMEPDLLQMLTLYKDTIEMPSTGSFFKVLAAEAPRLEGLNPSFTVADELHVFPNRELWDVLSLASGARPEPLMIAITTAGVRTNALGKDSLAFSMYNYGKRVALGEKVDSSFFMAWWEPKDLEAPLGDLRASRQANPGLDDLVSVEEFEASLGRTPEAEFRTKRLNTWVSSSSPWLPEGEWDDRGVDVDLGPDGEVCGRVVIGFDGSYRGDSTALVACTVDREVPLVFPIGLWERSDAMDLDWRVPIREVEDRVRSACERFDVVEICADPYRWARSIEVLLEEGLPMVVYPQSPARMTPATQKLFDAVVNDGMEHDGDPLIARHVDNATLKSDARGSRLAKENQNRKIDAAVAMIMAFDRATWWASQPVRESRTVYGF